MEIHSHNYCKIKSKIKTIAFLHSRLCRGSPLPGLRSAWLAHKHLLLMEALPEISFRDIGLDI
jgi:hypothetical protein